MSILSKLSNKVKKTVVKGEANFNVIEIPKKLAEQFYEADKAEKIADAKRTETKGAIVAFLTEKKADKGISSLVTFSKVTPKDKLEFQKELFKANEPVLYKKYSKKVTPTPYYTPSIQTANL